MKSIKKTYFIAIAASLVPAWIGSGLLSKTASNIPLHQDSYALISIIFFSLSFWGTSWAFFYLGIFKYGVISGIGKLAIIFGSVVLYNMTQGNGHPYIIFVGITLAFLWGIFDLFLLYKEVKKHRESV